MDIGDVKYLEAPAKVLNLSEAIRIGAKIRPQCTDGVFTHNGRSCAFGAGTTLTRSDQQMTYAWFYLLGSATCIVCIKGVEWFSVYSNLFH